MGTTLQALIVEDSRNDAELLLIELARAGYDVSYERVETADAMQTALETKTWDVVFSDYSLPTFSGPRALDVLTATGQDLPFIIVSGTIGEETAVSALKAGADDFIVKGHMARLVPALQRAMRDAAARRERDDLEEQLRHAQKMEAIGRLAGGIAHDFNNLLTAILGYSQLLIDRLQDQPDVVADLDEIRKAGERARSLTRQLLAFSRKQVLEPQVFDLNGLVADVEKMLQRIIGEDVRLETTLAEPLGYVKADPGQIEQVLINLVVNARDAMPRGGVLTIRTAVAALPAELTSPDAGPQAYVSLTVADTGCGMSPEVRARVFEPFFTTKGPDKGTGLGLSTAYGIISQSHGHITVESVPDQGTTFTVHLPVADESLDAADSALPDPATLTGTETILLVDDEPGVRELARRVLQERGYDVLDAADTATALAIARNHPEAIHLLLSDIVMPGLNGPDLAQRVVSSRPRIQVLYISGYPHLATGFGAMSARTAFLQKPFAPEQLLRKVRERLDRGTAAAGQPS